MKRIYLPGREPTWQILGNNPTLELRSHFNLCVGDYKWLLLDEAVPRGFSGQQVLIFWRFDNEKKLRSYGTTVSANAKMSEYGLMLKGLRAKANTRITLLGFYPVRRMATSGTNRIQIRDFRLVPLGGKTRCR